ncbi:hypothetical protein NQZ68_035984 [Dissostichus eleginoides]|nr:hypothetical protein NQZ68_035984 [Dissostichus eleginoides]
MTGDCFIGDDVSLYLYRSLIDATKRKDKAPVAQTVNEHLQGDAEVVSSSLTWSREPS